MNPIARRTVSALSVAAAAAAGILYMPVWVVMSAIALLILAAQCEFLALASKKCETMKGVAFLVSAAFLAAVAVLQDNSLPAVAAVFAIGVFAVFRRGEGAIPAFASTVLSFAYIPFMLSYFFLYPVEFGPEWLLYVVAIVKVSDMGGFAFGVAFGKHKMCPSVSPNKSWEGMAGSIFASSLVSCAFIPVTHFAFPKAIAFGIAAAVAGTLGDLVESKMKRDAGVKDSSTFLPAGMGGVLDTFDSLVFVPALFWHFI